MMTRLYQQAYCGSVVLQRIHLPTGEEKVVAIGKFWTVSHYSSDIFGGLKGSSTLGYDPKTKKFVGT